jgi:hypothetical protein
MATTTRPRLPLKSYRFHFETAQNIRLPEYPGSAWRGAFGHALKKTVCIVRNTPCKQCLLQSACAYSYIFETPPPANSEKMRKYTAAPHPFVLQLPQTAAANNQTYILNLILYGHGQRYFPYMVHALQNAGLDGIGNQQLAFVLHKITDISLQADGDVIYQKGELLPQAAAESPAIPAMPNQIELYFPTPLRIKQDSKNLTSHDFSFGAFFGALLRRISMLSYFHTDTPLETDFAALTAKARTVRFSAQQLKWFDWTRYSSRQQTEMQMGGLLGSVNLDMQGLEEFWPYLWLGQWTHVGKGATMGMGAYSISAASLPNHPKLEIPATMPS